MVSRVREFSPALVRTPGLPAWDHPAFGKLSEFPGSWAAWLNRSVVNMQSIKEEAERRGVDVQ